MLALRRTEVAMRLWNYKLTQTFRAKIKESFVTHGINKKI